MDQFAQLKADERRDYFEAASAKLGNMSADIVQKDFWVCWTLKRLFSLQTIGDHLTFKGGTSLSKVYGIIKRFSEDIDVSIERKYLGFGGDNDPENAPSNKERERRLQKLKTACQDTIKDRILPEFHQHCESTIAKSDWSLALDPEDPDQQTILFAYPNANAPGPSNYVRPVVKIELGARSDHWPSQQTEIHPYLCDALPDAISNKTADIKVLAAERTFWEKATILHMLYHLPMGKPFPTRMSRHYYDLYMLLRSPVKNLALKNLDLLGRVAAHKAVFFRAASAKYDEARQGTLRLAPPDTRKADLKSDFDAMSSMFFDKTPDFETIMTDIAAFDLTFNRK